MSVPELVTRWRAEAELLRAHGALEAASTKERDASDLEVAVREWELEELTVKEAAAESGFSPSALRKTYPGQRRIRRGDLPRKARLPGVALTTETGRRVAKAGAEGHLDRVPKSHRSTSREEEP